MKNLKMLFLTLILLIGLLVVDLLSVKAETTLTSVMYH